MCASRPVRYFIPPQILEALLGQRAPPPRSSSSPALKYSIDMAPCASDAQSAISLLLKYFTTALSLRASLCAVISHTASQIFHPSALLCASCTVRHFIPSQIFHRCSAAPQIFHPSGFMCALSTVKYFNPPQILDSGGRRAPRHLALCLQYLTLVPPGSMRVSRTPSTPSITR